MTDNGRLPVSIRDNKPHIHATRLTGYRPDGLPDGIHTGGAWLTPEGEVWKALDGRPYANCEYHYPTKEAEFLEAFKGRPLFPKNWRIETANGRRWIVRKKAYIYEQDKRLQYSNLKLNEVLEVEQSIRYVNQQGWEINDPILLALDLDTYDIFLFDLSSAHKLKDAHMANEEWRITQFFELCGYDKLKEFRTRSATVLHELRLLSGIELSKEHRNIYASPNRPMSAIWATIPNAVYVDGGYPKDNVWTWVITPRPLDEETIYRYELTWGWSPLHQ